MTNDLPMLRFLSEREWQAKTTDGRLTQLVGVSLDEAHAVRWIADIQ
jgi:hypothetical protein